MSNVSIVLKVAPTVGVIGRQEASESGHCGAPVRVLQVIAAAIKFAVTLHLARRIGVLGRAESGNGRVFRIDQRQPRVDSVSR